MRPKPAFLAILAILALASTGLSVAQDAAKPAAKDIEIDLKTEKTDVRDALRVIFKQANVYYTIAPEIQGIVSADFRGLVLEDAVTVVLRQVDGVVRVQGGIYQIVPREDPPRFVLLDGPIPGAKVALQPEPQTTFAGSDDKCLYFLRDSLLLKVDKATMKVVATLALGGRRIRISY